MTVIKLCGMSRKCDIDAVNELKPDYIGFVFAPKSRRYVSPQEAADLRRHLREDVRVAGVFVNESLETVANLLQSGVIDIAQLHGNEDETYIEALRVRGSWPIFKAFKVETEADVEAANACSADMILLDSGSGGTGTRFKWELAKGMRKPYLLAGGLDCENIEEALDVLDPYGVDVSSGIETDGLKDRDKMIDFVNKIRKGRR